MIEFKEIELDFKDGLIGWKSAKGTFKRDKVFSHVTDRVIYWAEMSDKWNKLGLDYCGG